MAHPPLLITTAINPPAGLKNLRMTSQAKRLIATKCGIFFWASQNVRQIVVADATETKVLSPDEEALLASMGCRVEQIAYRQREADTLNRGKGYAEGQLIAFAVNSSALLAQSDSFFKSTGKTFCRNFGKVLQAVQANKCKSVFWTGSYTGADLRFVDLRFFLCSKSFFGNVLLAGYEQSAEMDFVEATVTGRIASQLASSQLPRPQISGFSGGFDAQYPEIHFGDLESSFPAFVEK